MGQDTDFVKELSVGDTILVTVVDRFRGSSTNESRRVNMVLGRSARRPARRAARRPRRAQVCARARSVAQRGGALLLRPDEPDQLHVRKKSAGPRGDPSRA
jgi:hypothetical protein